MKRYFKLALLLARVSLQASIEHPIDYALSGVGALLQFLASLAVLLLMFEHGPSIGGWSRPEVLLLMGVFLLMTSMVSGWVMPNLGSIPEEVRAGTLDSVLLMPVDAQFFLSFRVFNPLGLFDTLIGALLTAYALWELRAGLSLESVLLLALLLLAAGVLIYSLWLIAMTLAVWVIDVANMGGLINIMFRFGQFPDSVFPHWLRRLLTFGVPVLLIFTVPASVVTDHANARDVCLTLIYAVTALVVSRWFWLRALRNYSGAST
jgi:ABC-2 type transport system permease protein